MSSFTVHVYFLNTFVITCYEMIPELLLIFVAFLQVDQFVYGAKNNANKQPNIIFILADDLGNADVGFTDSGHVKTPSLDRMASEG